MARDGSKKDVRIAGISVTFSIIGVLLIIGGASCLVLGFIDFFSSSLNNTLKILGFVFCPLGVITFLVGCIVFHKIVAKRNLRSASPRARIIDNPFPPSIEEEARPLPPKRKPSVVTICEEESDAEPDVHPLPTVKQIRPVDKARAKLAHKRMKVLHSLYDEGNFRQMYPGENISEVQNTIVFPRNHPRSYHPKPQIKKTPDVD